MFEIIKERIVKNTRLILAESNRKKVSPREIALEIARRRVKEVMKRRKII
jgi:glutamate dehydrogenase/leucine dehydrogenase